ALPVPLCLFPPRRNLRERRFGKHTSLGGFPVPPLRCLELVARSGEGAPHALRVRHATHESLCLRTYQLSPVARERLRRAKLLVAQYARKELRTLCRPHGRHHVKLLLPGEVGVEELRPRHPQPALEKLRHRTYGVRDRLLGTVQVQLCTREAPGYTVAMARKFEVQLDSHWRACTGPIVPDRIARSPGGGIAIQRPRDRLQHGRLAGT